MIAALLSIWTTLGTPPLQAFQCDTCHSKNPAMVAMHKAVEKKGIGCFHCHKVGETLMGKAPSEDRASEMARRSAEPVCAGCHDKIAKSP
jgi:hypothetical protein